MGNCQETTCRSFLENNNLTTNIPANIIDQINAEFIVQTDNENTYDPIYGQIDILEFHNRSHEFKLAHKIFSYYDKEEYKKMLKYFEQQFNGLLHPNLLIIHAMQNKKIDQFFTTEYKISIFLDYPLRTFSQEMQIRKKMFFDESEVLNFMDSTIGALAFLQSKGISHGQLTLDNIYLVRLQNGNTAIKLYNPIQLETTNIFKEFFELTSDGHQMIYSYPYLSPEQLEMLRLGKIDKYDEFKSDVYTLGLIILEICTLKKSQSYYDNNRIDYGLLQQSLIKLQDRYSEQVSLIVNAMLSVDKQIRCDFLELDEILNSSALKGKRIAQSWNYDDYQYCINTDQTQKKVQFTSKSYSLAHPELGSQLSNQSKKGSYLSIRQVLSKNSKESKASSAQQHKDQSYSPQQFRKKTLFKKLETENASRTGSKKQITNQFTEGVSVEPDGLIYRGQFLLGKKHGFGKILDDEDEIIYEGQFQENKYHIHGIVRNPNPQQEPINCKDFNTVKHGWVKYEGNFQHGMKSGVGTFTFYDGSKYIGQFLDDKIHGTGTYYFQNGANMSGQWNNNILQ